MKRPLRILAGLCAAWWIGGSAVAGEFTPLPPLEAPRIIASATRYPGGNLAVENMIDGDERTEYATANKGTETFIDFDFGRPTRFAAFRHVDRRDPATVDTAELLFSDTADFSRVLETIPVKHANRPSGVTFLAFEPVTSRYVRWHVTAVKSYTTVGGAEITFYSTDDPEPSPTRTRIQATAFPALQRVGGGLRQPGRVTIKYPYAEPTPATLRIAGSPPMPLELRLGSQTVDTSLPPVQRPTEVKVTVEVEGKAVAESTLATAPVRRWEMVFLPHSHVDIGYTHVQTEVERRQWQHLDEAIALARRTADYPPEARFRWNSEVLWAVDGYLRQATPEKRQALIEAVRKGQVGLDGLYGNELTALCRPEELMHLTDCARRLAKDHGLTIDSAMISDVPGYTWGIVPVLAQSGIKYFSIGPNHIHRIGFTLRDWGDKAFYWRSPSGQEKVLCWMAGKAYSWFHPSRLAQIKQVKPEAFFEYLTELAQSGYPYDMVQVRYSVGGDNGPPDPDLPEFVKTWNARYAWPKLAIATTGELFREFERRYGDRIPEVRGDFTPYWEDGAGSSARETGINRAAAERLVQAEALWAMLRPREYPDERFYAAWRNAILYDEHTWGAYCSINDPDGDFTRSQWKIKQAFALDAQQQSRELLRAALRRPDHPAGETAGVQAFNTSSWPRTDLIVVPKECSAAGDRVTGPDGRPVPSQRLSDGRLAFLASGVPPFGAKRYTIGPGPATPPGDDLKPAGASGRNITNGRLSIDLDEKTGAIAGIRAVGIDGNLVDRRGGVQVNDYFYVAGRNPKDPLRCAEPAIRVKEAGPLVASLLVEGDAPGCRKLAREVRLVSGSDHAELIDVVDKEQVRTKEAVHFGFAWNVPEGVMRIEIPWGVVRPETDQLRGACKNYFTAQRFVDVSNDRFGVTCATVDAPLVEVGAITVDVPHPLQQDGWIEHLEPAQTFYSYAMNNYWETNYKASQQGPTVFRYAVRPHAGTYNALDSARFGIEQSQPLVVTPATPRTPPEVPSLLRVTPPEVIVTSLKPSRDGKAWIVRLYGIGVGERPAQAELHWRDPQPKTVWLSNPAEEPKAKLTAPVQVPPMAIITLRAELP